MRILAVADVEDDLLLSRLARPESARYDLVISCGDLGPSYLDAVATLANTPGSRARLTIATASWATARPR